VTSLPSPLYLVVRHYGFLGLGCCDVSDKYGDACNQFADAVESGEPVSVWEIDTDGRSPTRAADITDFVEREFLALQRRRGREVEVVRFELATHPEDAT
jgi:hypothetical protein